MKKVINGAGGSVFKLTLNYGWHANGHPWQ